MLIFLDGMLGKGLNKDLRRLALLLQPALLILLDGMLGRELNKDLRRLSLLLQTALLILLDGYLGRSCRGPGFRAMTIELDVDAIDDVRLAALLEEAQLGDRGNRNLSSRSGL